MTKTKQAPQAPVPCVQTDPMTKLVNPQLAQAALNGADRFGDFKAYVRLRAAATQPAGYQPIPCYGADIYAASIPCAQFERIVADANVLSVELREYVTS